MSVCVYEYVCVCMSVIFRHIDQVNFSPWQKLIVRRNHMVTGYVLV